MCHAANSPDFLVWTMAPPSSWSVTTSLVTSWIRAAYSGHQTAQELHRYVRCALPQCSTMETHLHDLWTRDKHVGGVLHHEGEIGYGW